MNILKTELIVGVDIDNTLLMWDDPSTPGKQKIEFDFADKKVYLTPHQYHIDLVKMYHQRGYYIIFWSANGWAHAEQAVKVLNLEKYATGDNGRIQAKLTKHMDDSSDSQGILGPRVYCEDLTKIHKDDFSTTINNVKITDLEVNYDNIFR